MELYKNYIDLDKLRKELHYYPSWYKDKNLFFELLNKSNFSDKDIINLGRIYVKYSHLNKFSELTKYLNYILQKTDLNNSKTLFKKTRHIYYTKRNKCKYLQK